MESPQSAFIYSIPHISLCQFDLGGVLYHANYFHLYEQAREALLLSGEISYPSIISNSYHLAIIESGQVFKQPIYYGEKIELFLWAEEITSTTVNIKYLLYKENKLIHQAFTKLVLVKNIEGKYKPQKIEGKLLTCFQGILKKKI